MEQRAGAFTLLRELPSRPTQRTCKLSTELNAASTERDQHSFAGSEAEQQLLLHSFQASRDGLGHIMRELQQQTMGAILEQLQHWAVSASAQGHPDPSMLPVASRPSSSHSTALHGLLPTVALSLASSTNTSEAYAHLLCTLKQQGHPAALISARDASSGLSAVANSAMRQFLNSPTAADDVPALLAWWKDELQRSSSSFGGSNRPPAGAASTPSKTPQSQESPAAGDAADMDVDKTPAATPSRQLRARAAKTPAGSNAGSGPGSQHSSQAVQLQVPVMVLQDADGIDAEALEELVVALHEAQQLGLPLVLVLGITMSHHGLLQLLTNSTLRRIQLLQLSLPPAWQQLARFYRAVLLTGPQPRVVLGPRCAAWLLEHFRDVDASASMAQRATQLAYVEHHLGQPLSCLAPAAASGSRRKLHAAIKALPPGHLWRCCQALTASVQAGTAAAAATSSADASAGSNSASSAAEVTAAQDAALAHLQGALEGNQGSRRGQGTGPASEASSAAAAVLEGAVWGAMTAFQQWRVGLLMLDLVAKFTGAAGVDASLQLPALYAAAQQPGFLATNKRGVLSSCSRLLLKLLGNSTCSGGPGSSWPARAGVVPVDKLSAADCTELLQKLLQLLKATQQGCTAEQGAAEGGGGQGRHGDASSSSDDDSSSDSEGTDSGSDSDGGSEGGSESGRRHRSKQHHLQAVVANSPQLQQMVQALEALQEAAAAAGTQESADQGLKESLAAFCCSFAGMLTPVPEQLEAPVPTGHPAGPAGSIGGDLEELEDAAALGMLSTPAGAEGSRNGAASVSTPLPTPGGLASALRKRVRFAPDTPDHAGAKAAGASSSAKSTPDDEAAPGHIKTPNKRGSGSKGKKPRKKLFDNRAAAAAAAAAAADGSSGKPRRSSRKEKQQSEVGDIAGSSAAALAAVAAAAAAGGAGSAAMGNKRHARLMGMIASGLTGSSPAAAAAAGPGSKSQSPKVAAQVVEKQQQQAGLLFSPTSGGEGAATAGAASPQAMADSPTAAAGSARSRLRNSSNSASPAAGTTAAAAAAAEPVGMLSPARGRVGGADGSRARSSSRLSRRSGAAADAAQAEQHPEDDAMQLQDDGSAEHLQQQASAAGTAAPDSCGTALAQLLHAAIPKLLLDWSRPGSQDSSLYTQLSSSILQQQHSLGHHGGGSSSSTARAEAVAAGTSLAAAGAAAFVFDDVQLLEQHLAPAAPAVTHAALIAPGSRLQGHPFGVGAQGWEDTCLAYVLLQQQRDDGMPVSDWFGLFCEALGLQGFQQGPTGAAQADGDTDMADAGAAAGGIGGAAGGVVGTAAGRAHRSRARTGRKARGYADARGAAAAAAAAEGPVAAAAGSGGGAQTPRRRGRQQQDQDRAGSASAGKPGRKRRGSAAAAASGDMDMDAECDRDTADAAAGAQQQEVDPQELLSAAARFSQAAAELQLLGVWKGTKRRRAAGVLRVFAPEGRALPSMAAAAEAAEAGAADV